MGSSQMQPCTLREVSRLLDLCNQENVGCSVEINSIDHNDQFVTIVDEIPKADYSQSEDEEYLVVDMRTTQMTFESDCQCGKSIDGTQIMVSLANEHHIAWFNSQSVSVESARKARWNCV